MKTKKYALLAIAILILLVCVSCKNFEDERIYSTPQNTPQNGEESATFTPTVPPTLLPTATTEPEPTSAGMYSNALSGIDLLVLANRTHLLAEDYVPKGLVLMESAKKSDNYSFNKSGMYANCDALFALDAMLDAAKTDGIYDFVVVSGYRDYEYQQMLFDRKLATDENYGSDITKPVAVAVPGTSEHQTGLALDIVSAEHLDLTSDFEDTPHGKWLVENCYRFGFILRYPKDCEDITIVIYEPWHFRYVGLHTANEIHELGITLEEYLRQS